MWSEVFVLVETISCHNGLCSKVNVQKFFTLGASVRTNRGPKKPVTIRETVSLFFLYGHTMPSKGSEKYNKRVLIKTLTYRDGMYVPATVKLYLSEAYSFV